MLSTADATAIIRSCVATSDTETVPLAAAAGRTLRQAAIAERDQPPFDRVMMDGIALCAGDLEANDGRLPLQGMQAAGDDVLELEPGHAIEIMTGAVLPAGADSIVPVERIRIEDGVAVVDDDFVVHAGRFVHPRGSDHAAGARLIEPGRQIAAADIAILASCGLADVSVSRLPDVAVISTGNELVPAGQAILPQQIRLSNGPAIVALVEGHRLARAVADHLPDDPETLRAAIERQLQSADVLVLSGGVSMGKADFVPGILADLGVEQRFHRVAQRPGKPLWFGTGADGKLVFGLPGNPVSALVCCREYVVPALALAAGRAASPPLNATLARDVAFEPDLTCFLPVRIAISASGQQLAMPVHTNTSGDFASLGGTDGYVELVREQATFPAGSAVPLRYWTR